MGLRPRGDPETLGAAAAAKLGEAGSTLLAGTLLDDGDLGGTDAPADMRAHVIGYLRAHLDDPQLSRSSIAAAHHCRPAPSTGCSRTSPGRSAA